MEKGQRPHGKNNDVLSGTAHAGKGEQVNTGHGPVGAGGRPGGAQPQQGNRAGQKKGGLGTAAAAAGGLWLLSKLPPKYRRIVLIALVVIVGISLLRGCNSGPAEEYVSYAPTATPVATAVPTAVPTQAPIATQAPIVTQAPAVPAVTNVGSGRAPYVTPLGNGQDTVTVMIYMCGTDLESNYGMATSDLQEMINAKFGNNVNLIIETGGCKKWKNNVMSNTANEIYRVYSGGNIERLQQFKATAMTDPDNLASFIQFCSANYPASRNILIFWDHGGGSLTGYGYDEKFPSSSSMTLTKIDSALSKGGVKFDWIGFDACLMATLETDLVCEKYADYIIASEESEPGTGWYYTDWLTQLGRNTSIPTTETAKTIIDTFVAASQQSAANAQVTLSVVDLAELSGAVPAAFSNFAVGTSNLISTNFNQVSSARQGTRQFAASSKLNQIDLIDFCSRLNTPESVNLANALQSCIKYNKSTITRSYGVSIYFPYESTGSLNSAVSIYKAIGLDDAYTKCIKTFASVGTGSQIGSYASSNSSYGSGSYGSYADLLGTLLGGYGSSGSGYSNSYSSYGGNSYGSSAMGSLLGSLAGGYSNSYGSSSAGYSLSANDLMGLMSAFSGRSMPSGMEWVDTEAIAANAQQIADNTIDPGLITVTEKNGTRVLSLSDEDWAKIATAELNLFVDDGEGYIDLGLDNTFSWDDDGDMILDWNGAWYTIDGNVVAIYLDSDTENDDGTYTSVSHVPALVKTPDMETEALMNVQVVFDSANPNGVITGAYPMYEDETETIAKGMIQITEGTRITPLCDYYTYDGEYQASYELGGTFTVSASPVLGYMALDNQYVSVTYRLTDYCGNTYWTPAFVM